MHGMTWEMTETQAEYELVQFQERTKNSEAQHHQTEDSTTANIISAAPTVAADVFSKPPQPPHQSNHLKHYRHLIFDQTFSQPYRWCQTFKKKQQKKFSWSFFFHFIDRDPEDNTHESGLKIQTTNNCIDLPFHN